MDKKLYKVNWVRQDTGLISFQYAFADNMAQVEDEYADIISIEPCSFITLPEVPNLKETS